MALSSGRHASSDLKAAVGNLAGALSLMLNDMLVADPSYITATKKALDQIAAAAGLDNPFVLQAQKDAG